jgi:hypothetical protein
MASAWGASYGSSWGNSWGVRRAAAATGGEGGIGKFFQERAEAAARDERDLGAIYEFRHSQILRLLQVLRDIT